MVEYKKDMTYNFFIRNEDDRKILYESKNYRPLFNDLPPGFCALDLGAHIGSFARLCYLHGAGLVDCYEPYWETYKLLEQNLEHFDKGKFQAYNLAIGRCNTGRLYVHENTANNSMFSRSLRSVGVQQLKFEAAVTLNHYQIVKIDVEGAEHKFNLRRLPDCVKRLAIEMHRNEDVPRLHQRILSLGFTSIVPDIDDYIAGDRCVLGLYVR